MFDDNEEKSLKISRPMIKLTWFILKTWGEMIRKNAAFRKDLKLTENFFRKYNVTFLENKL